MACAVSANTGIDAVRSSCRSRVSASMPSIPGSCTSMSTSAGSCVRATSTASSPVVASSVVYPVACSTSQNSFMFFSLSSTTRTRSSAISTPLVVREGEDETAAVPGLALDPDPSAVELDEALRKCEPEPRALGLLHADIGLLELLENPLPVLGRDSRARVGHGHLHLAVHLRGGDHDAT